MKIRLYLLLLTLLGASFCHAAVESQCIEDADKNAPYLFYFQKNADGKSCTMKRWDSQSGAKRDILKLDFCSDQDQRELIGGPKGVMSMFGGFILTPTSDKTFKKSQLDGPASVRLPGRIFGWGYFKDGTLGYYEQSGEGIFYLKRNPTADKWEGVPDLFVQEFNQEKRVLEWVPRQGSIPLAYDGVEGSGNIIHTRDFEEALPLGTRDWRSIYSLTSSGDQGEMRNRYVRVLPKGQIYLGQEESNELGLPGMKSIQYWSRTILSLPTGEATIYWRQNGPTDVFLVNAIRIVPANGKSSIEFIDGNPGDLNNVYAGGKYLLISKSMGTDATLLVDLETGQKVNLAEMLHPFWVARHDCPE